MKTLKVTTPTLDAINRSLLAKFITSRNCNDTLLSSPVEDRAFYVHRDCSVESARAISHCLKSALNHEQNAHFVLDMSSSCESWFSLAAASHHNSHCYNLLAYNHLCYDTNSGTHKTSLISNIPLGLLVPKSGLSQKTVDWLNSCVASYKDFFNYLLSYSDLPDSERTLVFNSVNALFGERVMDIHHSSSPESWGNIVKDDLTVNYVRLPSVLESCHSRNFLVEFYLNLIDYLVEHYKMDVGLSVIGFSLIEPDLLKRVINSKHLKSIVLTDIEDRPSLVLFKPSSEWAMYLGRVNSLSFVSNDTEVEQGLGCSLSNGVYRLAKGAGIERLEKASLSKVRECHLPSYFDSQCRLELLTPLDSDI